MTSKKLEGGKRFVYEATVTGAGVVAWLAAVVSIVFSYTLPEQLFILALAPLLIVTGMFPNTFPVPSGLKFTQEKISFTLTDAVVLLVACCYGPAPAVFIAAVEGFTSSRRTVRRLSSNLFSFGMIALSAGASALCLGAVLRYGFGEAGVGTSQSFPAVTVALLAASLLHITVNTGLFSAFFALRQAIPVLQSWRQHFIWAAPIALPTSAVASLFYIALQYDALVTIVIGAPVLLALYFGHKQYRDSVQARIDLIERTTHERIELMDRAHRQTIEALAVAINAKDEVTHGHVLRVQIYAAGVARLLGCDEAEVEALRAGALLHDIGKIAVPDHILNKPGKLTAAEFDKMKLHTIAGAQILGRVEFPYPVVPVVRHHHERWDGKGYPDGLKAEEIPLTARILSVVDCFDAVREDRQYRKAMTREEAVSFIMQGSGTQYDPRVVGTFITNLPVFEAEIQARRDDPAPSYGIAPMEQLSEAALKVEPAAGLAEEGAPASAREDVCDEGQRSLHELARALNVCDTADEVLRVFTDKLASVVPFDTCAVTRVMPEGGVCVVAHAAGRHARLLEGRHVSPGEGVTGWVLANRQPFANADPRLDLPTDVAEHFADYRTLSVAPLGAGEKFYGAVSLYTAALAEYTPAHRRLLEEASAVAAAALDASLNPTRAGHGPVVKPPALSPLRTSEPTLDSTLTH